MAVILFPTFYFRNTQSAHYFVNTLQLKEHPFVSYKGNIQNPNFK